MIRDDTLETKLKEIHRHKIIFDDETLTECFYLKATSILYENNPEYKRLVDTMINDNVDKLLQMSKELYEFYDTTWTVKYNLNGDYAIEPWSMDDIDDGYIDVDYEDEDEDE